MIVVLGSANADLVFPVERLPAPGETVLTERAELLPGGKGANQAAAAAKAGAGRGVAVRFVGCVGSDAFGPVVRRALADAGCEVSGLRVADAPTGTAAVLVDASGENQIVVASGANLMVTAAMLDDASLGPGDMLVCQMEIQPRETEAALRRAKAAGARTLLNLAPAQAFPAEALAAVDILAVNTVEARALAPELSTPDDLARTLAARHDLACIVTLGGAGALARMPDGTGWRFPALPIAPVDTVGAGDAFVGGLAAALDSGRDLVDAIRDGMAAGALTCLAPGAMTAQPSAERIAAALAELPPAECLHV